MTRVVLEGCRAEPLGSYLKALGVHRLVAEQLDGTAVAYWLGDRLVLDSSATEDDLVDFFAERYRPTSLLSPWNGGSGFGAKDKEPALTVSAIEASTDDRLASYRDAVKVVRRLVAAPDWAEGPNKDAVKREQVLRCRNELPDEAVAWIDAAIVLGAEGRTIAPLFVSGGNDGRLEFSANFMDNVLAGLGLARMRKGADRHLMLRASLLGTDPGILADGSSGPYDPGAGGGVNSAPSGNSGAMVNPWDYILMFEGGLLFASGAARRLGTDAGMASVPFCVQPSRVGSATPIGDGEEVRAEIWAPIWRRPSTAVEVARLIGEGRAELGRRAARNGVDFALAAATLGVDRGIDTFVRHGLVKRFGKNHIAVALDRVAVGRHPALKVTAQVDEWLSTVSRKDLPAGLASALRRLERALYRAATASGPLATRLQDVLIALATAERFVGGGSKPSDRAWRPVDGLRATNWMPWLDDATPELRLAAAMASGRDPSGMSLALMLRPIELDGRLRRLEWRGAPPAVAGLGRKDVVTVLASALVRRTLDLEPSGEDRGPGNLRARFEYGRFARLDDVTALVEGRLDEARLGQLVEGLLLLDWRKDDNRAWFAGEERVRAPAVRPIFAAVGPCLAGAQFEWGDSEDGFFEVRLGIERSWPQLLLAGRTADVWNGVLRRYCNAGLDPAVRPNSAGASHDTQAGERLAAAAFCRLRRVDALALVRQICPPDPRKEEA